MPLSANALTSALQWLLSTANPTIARPTAWYVSAHSSAPGATGAGELSTGAAPGYARVAIGASGMSVAGGVAGNPTTLTFAATGAWPAIGWLGLWDAASGGNFLGYAAIVQSGTPFTLAAVGVAGPGANYTAGDVGKTVNVGATGATATITAVSNGGVSGLVVNAAGAVSGAANLPASPVATSGGGTAGAGLVVDAYWSQSTTTIQLNGGDSLTIAASGFSVSLNGQLVYSPA